MSTILKSWRTALVLALTLGLADCAEQGVIDTSLPGPILRVRVQSQVNLAEAALRDIPAPLGAVLQADHADIAAISLQELKAGLDHDPRFQRVHQNPDVQLSLRVDALEIRTGEADDPARVQLTLNLQAQDAQGRLIYEDSRRVANAAATRYPSAALLNEPTALRAVLHDVAQQAVSSELHELLAQAGQGLRAHAAAREQAGLAPIAAPGSDLGYSGYPGGAR